MIKIRDYRNSPCMSLEVTRNSPGKESTCKSFPKK